MTTVAIRHVAFEDLGTFAAPLAAHVGAVMYLDAPVADFRAFDPLWPDLLVVLGGPVSANDERLYPFLAAEVDLVKRRLAAGRPILGLCLGAQLLARALGARVYRGPKEIGWAPVALEPRGYDSPLRHLVETHVLHWHGDTFDLPVGATRLASTPGTPNQAFVFGPTLGLQFHVEAEELEPWFVGHAVELAADGIDLRKLRLETARHAAGAKAAGLAMLSEWLTEVNLL